MVEILTAKEVANRLKVHLMTVYRWVSSGRLEVSRLPGGGLRIDARELEKLLGKNLRKTHTKRRRRTSAKPEK
ncbi:MAG: helix-turn-helix domain-containing protein [Dehalococcoidia bacterium]|nr:MAG: helix-turn-helix domain-containing protein [Dehalococcoidia bacterium]